MSNAGNGEQHAGCGVRIARLAEHRPINDHDGVCRPWTMSATVVS